MSLSKAENGSAESTQSSKRGSKPRVMKNSSQTSTLQNKKASSDDDEDEVRFIPVLLEAGGDESDSKTGVDSIREFCQVMRLVGAVHFHRFRIQTADNCNPIEWRAGFQEFITIVGKSVTFLDLRWPQLSIRDLRRLIFQQTPSLSSLYIIYGEDLLKQGGPRLSRPIPNLRRIKVASPRMIPSPAFVYFVLHVIEAAESLKYISAKLTYSHEGFAEAILNALPESSFRSKIEKLKTLKISVRTSAELDNLLGLSQRRGVHNQKFGTLRLNSLSLSVICQRTSGLEERKLITLLFHKFLASQTKTLRKLSLEFLRVSADRRYSEAAPSTNFLWVEYGTSFRVPHLDKLNTFKIARSEDMLIGLKFRGLGPGSKVVTLAIATTFPALTSLVYRHHQLAHVEDTKNLDNDLRQIAHSGVTRLKIVTTIKDFPKFGPPMFPALTDAHLTLNSSEEPEPTLALYGVTQIWGMWPGLTKLYLSVKLGTELDLDELLSGIGLKPPPGGSFPVVRFRPSLSKLLRLADRYSKQPKRSIRDLSQLQEFTLEPQLGSSGSLTDVGVWLGLALVGPQFKRVTFQGPYWSKMKNETSEESRAFLHSVMRPNAVIEL